MKETDILIGEEKIQVMMQSGFFDPTAQSAGVHKHQYTEVHVILFGGGEFTIDGVLHTPKRGDVVVVPPKKMHYFRPLDEKVEKVAFQITKNVFTPKVIHIGEAKSDILKGEIRRYDKEGKIGGLSSALSLVCSEICDGCANPLRSVSNRGFIINEFFSENYSKDVSLSDLALLLGVCEKQASRLVNAYTGRNFRDEITARRMEAAKYFMRDSEVSLAKLSEAVGYKSYSGFWKAFAKNNSD